MRSVCDKKLSDIWNISLYFSSFKWFKALYNSRWRDIDNMLFLFLQDITNIRKWFRKNMIKYLKNHTSKLALSRKFADGLLQDVVIRLDTFRSSMKEQFDDPLAEHLSDTSQEIKDHYIELLNKLIEGQYYFGDKMDFRQIASGMKIWRIPVSKKYYKYQQYRHIYIKMKYIHLTSMPYAWIGHPDRSKESGDGSGGRFKNTYELLILRAINISILYKIEIFQCMGKIFCVEFQRFPLKFHTKYLIHTLKDDDFIQCWKFKSS